MLFYTYSRTLVPIKINVYWRETDINLWTNYLTEKLSCYNPGAICLTYMCLNFCLIDFDFSFHPTLLAPHLSPRNYTKNIVIFGSR